MTADFQHELAESARPNPLSRRGLETRLRLQPDRPLDVRYIVAVASIPRGLDRVEAIEAVEGGVVLRSRGGRSVRAPLGLDFLDPGLDRARAAEGASRRAATCFPDGFDRARRERTAEPPRFFLDAALALSHTPCGGSFLEVFRPGERGHQRAMADSCRTRLERRPP